jgi:hypothetical protein
LELEKTMEWWGHLKPKLKTFDWAKWSSSAGVSTLCFVAAFFLIVQAFPPADVKTPFGFVLAFAVFAGMLCGVGAFVHDLIRYQGESLTQWRNHNAAFGVYILITAITPFVAGVLILSPIRTFVNASTPISSRNLGQAAKTGMLAADISDDVKMQIKGIEDVELGRQLAGVITEKSNDKYKEAIDRLEYAAFFVVLFYCMADCVGLVWAAGRTFGVMVMADILVIMMHLFSKCVIAHNQWPFIRSFTATMIQSFCGGIMGFSLLAQCIVFGFILPLSSSPGRHAAVERPGHLVDPVTDAPTKTQ